MIKKLAKMPVQFPFDSGTKMSIKIQSSYWFYHDVNVILRQIGENFLPVAVVGGFFETS